MKISKFTLTINDYPSEGKSLLYNTRTQAMAVLEKELKHVIDHYNDPQVFHKKMSYIEDLLTLYNMGIIVQNDEEDRIKLENFFYRLKYGKLSSCFSATILTTDACNFNCVYCFEKSSQSNKYMDEKTANEAIDWIKNYVKECDYRQVRLTFYGGEPLLNKPVLEYIAEHLQKWCSLEKIRFNFILQTNGYLIDPELIKKYLPLGLEEVRVSVDGLAEVHDKNRPLKNGMPTFNTVMQNIINCSHLVKIGISSSYEKDEISHIEKLFDYLEEVNLLKKLGQFVLAPLHPALGSDPNPKLFRMMACMKNYDDATIVSATKKIQSLFKKKGLEIPKGLTITACPINCLRSSITIDPTGQIFKCNSMLGHSELGVGHVTKNEFFKKHDEFLNADVWRKCPQDCRYLPMCSGGCRFMSYLEKFDFNIPSCKIRYLDEMMPDFIKQEYETVSSSNRI